MAYTPPSYAVVNFDFVGPPYTPPVWNAVDFPFAAGPPATRVYPTGFDAQTIGPPAIGFAPFYARPYGSDCLEVGDPVVSYRNRVVAAFGRNSLEVGLASIRNAHETAQALGFSDEAMGQPHVRLARQLIFAVADFDSLTFAPAANPTDRMNIRSSIGPTQIVRPLGFDLLASGNPLVAFALRYIIFLHEVEQTQWGVASVYPRVRHIYVPWSSFTQWGLPQFGWTPEIRTFGIDAAQYGTPGVTLGNLHPVQGWASLEMGEPLLRLMRRHINVAQWDERDKIGDAYVFNRTQILYVDNQQFFDYVPYMGAYTEVANRNRHITPDGWDSLHFTIYHRARLTGQAVLPDGLDATQCGKPMVAYRVRHVYPDTRYFFAGYIDPYHFVHNQARRIYPVGFSTQQFGLHRVWFNAQYIAPRYIQQDGYGKPFVAPRVRGLQQHDSYWEETFGTPWVSLRTRHIVEKPWTVPYGFGTPILYTHRNIITTFSIAYNLYGTPSVRNVTPQVWPSMTDQTEYGRAWISHAPRSLLPDVVQTTTIGAHQILFRTRTLYPPGIFQADVPMPTVRQEIPDQVTDQTIWPVGIPAPDPLPIPALRTHPHPAGWDSSQFGTTWIRVQGCKPYWALPDSFYGFGIPTINSVQTIVQTNPAGEPGAQTGWAKQRVDPHTIWAQTDPPPQAVANHPGFLFYPVGLKDNPPGDSLPPWFGAARVSTPSLQIIQHYHPEGGLDFTRGETFGPDTAVNNTKHYIYPSGFNAVHFGTATLPNPRHVWVLPWDSSVVETPTVSPVPFSTQYLHPEGIPPPNLAAQDVQNFNRNVYVSGFAATEYGNNFPMVYHYPRGPKDVSGLDSAVFGDEAWVSFKNRLCPVEGFDSFEEGYTVGMFKERMRVIGGPGHDFYSVGDALHMGVPGVAYGRGAPQYILPYMIPPPELCHPHAVEEV